MELAEADLVCLQDAADVEGHFDPGFKSRGYAAAGYSRRAGGDTGGATWFRKEVPLLAFFYFSRSSSRKASCRQHGGVTADMR